MYSKSVTATIGFDQSTDSLTELFSTVALHRWRSRRQSQIDHEARGEPGGPLRQPVWQA